jgi:hypothetical protein
MQAVVAAPGAVVGGLIVVEGMGTAVAQAVDLGVCVGLAGLEPATERL